LQNVGCLDRTVGVDAMALPGELVDQVKHTKFPASLGEVRNYRARSAT
jgi:hypothetical protein